MADKYLLRVTAGPGYDPSDHVVLPVNTSESTLIKSPHCTSRVKVRVQHYRGLPRGSASTSPYFSHPSHLHDQYSISFTFVPHESVSGAALVFGNDFDRPIRDRLPPGFSTAFRIAKWAVDPGLDGDPYADKPYLYSPLVATITRLNVGPKTKKGGTEDGFDLGEDDDEVIEEGAEGDGEMVRKEIEMPNGAAERKKWGYNEKEKWLWESGRRYSADFFNAYLDFNSFSLKLPGFSLPVLGHLGGEDRLRYVLKNKETGDVYFVVVFTLLLREDVEKEEAEEAQKKGNSNASQSGHKGDAAMAKGGFQPSADDLD